MYGPHGLCITLDPRLPSPCRVFAPCPCLLPSPFAYRSTTRQLFKVLDVPKHSDGPHWRGRVIHVFSTPINQCLGSASTKQNGCMSACRSQFPTASPLLVSPISLGVKAIRYRLYATGVLVLDRKNKFCARSTRVAICWCRCRGLKQA